MRRFRPVDAYAFLGGLKLAALGMLLLTAVACDAAPDFVTPRGAAFFLNGSSSISYGVAADQEANFIERLGQERPELLADGACFTQVNVHLVPGGHFPCAGAADTTCAGEQYGPHLKVADAPPEASAWRHELLHWLLECHGHPPDHAHHDVLWRLLDE